MAKLVSVNHFILNPKEYNGQRVVTFKDIDLVHGRAEGTARKRFADNKERFIEGVDYFVRKTDEAKKEFDIIAPNGLFLLTETGYLMLVKSFTDDLAWSVQRELVNNYFRNRVIQEKPKPKRREVVDIPINREFQKAFEEIRKSTIALDALLTELNAYAPPEDAAERMKTIEGIVGKIVYWTNFRMYRYKLMPEPY